MKTFCTFSAFTILKTNNNKIHFLLFKLISSGPLHSITYKFYCLLYFHIQSCPYTTVNVLTIESIFFNTWHMHSVILLDYKFYPIHPESLISWLCIFLLHFTITTFWIRCVPNLCMIWNYPLTEKTLLMYLITFLSKILRKLISFAVRVYTWHPYVITGPIKDWWV